MYEYFWGVEILTSTTEHNFDSFLLFPIVTAYFSKRKFSSRDIKIKTQSKLELCELIKTGESIINHLRKSLDTSFSKKRHFVHYLWV